MERIGRPIGATTQREDTNVAITADSRMRSHEEHKHQLLPPGYREKPGVSKTQDPIFKNSASLEAIGNNGS
jgi:hypothetical protein